MNKLSDEILKKKYSELHNDFIKGDFLNVIKECNKEEKLNFILIWDFLSGFKKIFAFREDTL